LGRKCALEEAMMKFAKRDSTLLTRKWVQSSMTSMKRSSTIISIHGSVALE
jgi:hypothetical protein